MSHKHFQNKRFSLSNKYLEKHYKNFWIENFICELNATYESKMTHAFFQSLVPIHFLFFIFYFLKWKIIIIYIHKF